MSSRFAAALFCVGLLAVGVRADEKPTPAPAKSGAKDKKPAFRAGAVRYQVKDVDKSVEFYTKHLGFQVDERYPVSPAFAALSNGSLTLWLSGPKSLGSRALPDGRKQGRAGGTGSPSRSMTCRRTSRR
jgi:hypothetical protein